MVCATVTGHGVVDKVLGYEPAIVLYSRRSGLTIRRYLGPVLTLWPSGYGRFLQGNEQQAQVQQLT